MQNWDGSGKYQQGYQTRTSRVPIALFEPEIPPNTTTSLDFAPTLAYRYPYRTLGFSMDEKLLRRAALDYQEYAAVQIHRDFSAAVSAINPLGSSAYQRKGLLDWILSVFKRMIYSFSDQKPVASPNRYCFRTL